MDLKNKIPTIFRYFIVGGIAAFSDLIIFYLFAVKLGINFILISIIGFLVATFINYILSVKFVFVSGLRFNFLKEILAIYLVSSFALIVHLSVLYLFIEVAEISKLFSKVIAIFSAFMFNYLLRKYYVFSKKRS